MSLSLKWVGRLSRLGGNTPNNLTECCDSEPEIPLISLESSISSSGCHWNLGQDNSPCARRPHALLDNWDHCFLPTNYWKHPLSLWQSKQPQMLSKHLPAESPMWGQRKPLWCEGLAIRVLLAWSRKGKLCSWLNWEPCSSSTSQDSRKIYNKLSNVQRGEDTCSV